ENDGVARHLERGVDPDPRLAGELDAGRRAEAGGPDAGRPHHEPGGDLGATREPDAAIGDRLDLRVQHYLDALAFERTAGRLAKRGRKSSKHMGRRLYKHHPDLVCVESAVI